MLRYYFWPKGDVDDDCSSPSAENIFDPQRKYLVIPNESTVSFRPFYWKVFVSAQNLPSSLPNRKLVSYQNSISASEQFTLELNDDATVYIRTCHGTYFRASMMGHIVHYKDRDEKSKFTIHTNPSDSSIYLKTHKNTYVSMDLRYNVTHISDQDETTRFVLGLDPNRDTSPSSRLLCVDGYKCFLSEDPNFSNIVNLSLPSLESSVQLYDTGELMNGEFPIQFKNSQIYFMSVKKGGNLTSGSSYGNNEIFTLVPDRIPNIYSFRTFHNTYLGISLDSQKVDVVQSNIRGSSECFVLRKFQTGAVLQAQNGGFVCRRDDGSFGLATEPSGATLVHFHTSFAPVRHNIDVKYYVDGKYYFATVYKHMHEAQESIYITGWFLSPNFFLIRPAHADNSEYRLSSVLLDRANNGVQVRILLWNNVEYVAPNKHIEAKKHLEGLHKNIKVCLQPQTIGLVPSWWSHHQKSVMIDNKIAFVGGLDLCLYRYDTTEHHVIEKTVGTFYGKDYYNARFTTDADLNTHEPDTPGGVDREKHPRMPWHDVHLSVSGSACLDVVLNFVQRWNFCNSAADKLEFNEEREVLDEGNYVCQVVRSMSPSGNGHAATECSVRDAYCKTIEDAESFVYIENQYFVDLEEDSAQFIVNAIVKRIERAFEKKQSFKIVVVLPQYPDNGDPVKSRNALMVMNNQRVTMLAIESKLAKRNCIARNYITYYSLRNYDILQNVMVTEQIYVHSKVMISDKATVVGSANINARSLQGDRDTELAVWVKSPEFGIELLRQLVAEHTGDDTLFPANLSFLDIFDKWHAIAMENSRCYANLFGKSIPDGGAISIDDYSQFRDTTVPAPEQNATEVGYSKIRGHLVLYPEQFLVTHLVNRNVIMIKGHNIYNMFQSTAAIFS